MHKPQRQGVKSFREYRQRLQAHAERAIAFFNCSNRSQRERAVCRALLRCLGVSFEENEIVAPTNEPADVSFRDARFQVREILEPCSRRHHEWKSRLTRAIRARSMSDVTVPSAAPEGMSLAELVGIVANALESKSQKYGKTQCSALDALVYADLMRTRFLIPGDNRADVGILENQGWRSVSAVFPPYGIVLLAHAEVPAFLRDFLGTRRNEWPDVHSLFDA